MYKRKSVPIKDFKCEDQKFTVSGYGSVFGNYDSDQDRMIKGCYNRSIQDWGPNGKGRIKMCRQHRLLQPVATITSLEEDDYGLKFTAQFTKEVDLSRNTYYEIKNGILSEFSVGFLTLHYDQNDHKGWDIKETKLYEISPVTFGSNELAKVTSVKSEVKQDMLKDLLKYAKTIDNKDQAFEMERKLFHLQLELAGSSPDEEQSPAEEDDQDTTKWLESVHRILNI